jgi:hypothetical protein
MSNAPLQQFSKKESAWRFLKLALRLRAPEPAFRHILITLAGYADAQGVCYPGYGRIMYDTGYTSDRTITSALKHWKDAGVLTWRKGWGNSHKQTTNVYQFHETSMEALIVEQEADSRNRTEPILETALTPDETALTQSRNRTEGGMKPHSMRSKVLALEGPSNITSQPSKVGAALPPEENFSGRQEQTAKQSHLEETALNTISSETALNTISSLGYDVPHYLEYDDHYPAGKRWGFARSAGSPTPEMLAEKNRLNRERIIPVSIQ